MLHFLPTHHTCPLLSVTPDPFIQQARSNRKWECPPSLASDVMAIRLNKVDARVCVCVCVRVCVCVCVCVCV